MTGKSNVHNFCFSKPECLIISEYNNKRNVVDILIQRVILMRILAFLELRRSESILSLNCIIMQLKSQQSVEFNDKCNVLIIIFI